MLTAGLVLANIRTLVSARVLGTRFSNISEAIKYGGLIEKTGHLLNRFFHNLIDLKNILIKTSTSASLSLSAI
jgi:catalase (peroxidase I)